MKRSSVVFWGIAVLLWGAGQAHDVAASTTVGSPLRPLQVEHGEAFAIVAEPSPTAAVRDRVLLASGFVEAGDCAQYVAVPVPSELILELARSELSLVTRRGGVPIGLHPRLQAALEGARPLGTGARPFVALDVEASGGVMTMSATLSIYAGRRAPDRAVRQVRISDFFPRSVTPGDGITLQGYGFPGDRADICSLVRNGNDVAGFTTPQASEPSAASLRLNAVSPGASSGTIMLTLGEGSTAPPQGLTDAVILDSWVWMATGNEPVAADETIDLGSAAPVQTMVCTQIYARVLPTGELSMIIPGGRDCPVGTTLSMQVDATSTFGTVSFDAYVALRNTVLWDTWTCAGRLGAAFQEVFFRQLGLPFLWGRSALPGGDVELTIIPPFGESFISGSAYINLCN